MLLLLFVVISSNLPKKIMMISTMQKFICNIRVVTKIQLILAILFTHLVSTQGTSRTGLMQSSRKHALN